MVNNLVNSTVRSLANNIARLFRGPSYQIDPDLPFSAIIGYGMRRAMALLRCLMHGVVLSLDPRKLVFIGPGVDLKNRSLISFGKGVTLGKRVMIDGLSREGVVIGDGVNIGPYSIIEATGVISNIGKGLRIGANSGVGAFSYIGAAGGISIGENVIMGQRVSFHSENHIFERIDVPIRLQGVTREGIIIENDCWIGANVTFLDGAHVGAGCVIAAGAVVRGVIPPYSVAVGVPAKVIKNRFKKDEL